MEQKVRLEAILALFSTSFTTRFDTQQRKGQFQRLNWAGSGAAAGLRDA